MEDIEKLKAENEQLKQMNAVKADLISISAHQLRTSLSAVKWILKMFIDRDVGEVTSEQTELLNKALISNERMIYLVNDLLTLSHAEDVTIPFKMKKTDIVELAEKTLFEFSGETHKKGIELIFLKPDEAIPEITCDEEMIRVVIQNLIENAVKYSNKGGKVVISIHHTSEGVEISVHDTGIGIELSEQASIFQKFYRTEEAKTKEFIGSGLGLFTTKNIVERHKGKIWFESKGKDQGTTFFVILPAN